MDLKNLKAMYFRAFALSKTMEYDQAVWLLQEILAIDPEHVEAKKLVAQVKKERQAYGDRAFKKFENMFS